MKIAIMQPYFFPYIGYFQLISSVDKFVFYDDVNFIKNGWINRNRILMNNCPSYFTIQLKNASSYVKINEIVFNNNRKKILKTIEQTYKKAPYFNECMPVIIDAFNLDTNYISELASNSVIKTCAYLNVSTEFEFSSKSYADSKDLAKSDRLIEICRQNNSINYINPIGGITIYTKQEFENEGINLYFLKSKEITYKQFHENFVSGLSIIDILMFNERNTIKDLLTKFELI